MGKKRKGRTNRMARECNQDRRQPISEGLGTFRVSPKLLPSRYRRPLSLSLSLFLSIRGVSDGIFRDGRQTNTS